MLRSTRASLLIPKVYLKDFDVIHVEDKYMEWGITPREKEDHIPLIRQGSRIKRILQSYQYSTSCFFTEENLPAILSQKIERIRKGYGLQQYAGSLYAGHENNKRVRGFFKRN